jgi:hypothetical protein
MQPSKMWAAVALLMLQAPPRSAVQGAAVRALIAGDFSTRAPAWSPDGARIAFESVRNAQWRIYVLDGWTPISFALERQQT